MEFQENLPWASLSIFYDLYQNYGVSSVYYEIPRWTLRSGLGLPVPSPYIWMHDGGGRLCNLP